MRKIIFIFTLLITVLIAYGGFSSVKIIRKAPPPSSDVNVTEAQWRKPIPEISEEKPRTIVKGKIEAGGTGGTSTDGESLFNLYSDSNVTVEIPLSFGRMGISGSALRKSFLQGAEDNYTVGFNIGSDLWIFNLDSEYGFSNKEEKDVNGNNVTRNSNNLVFAAGFSTSLVKNFTFGLSYNHKESKKEEDDNSTENIYENSFELKSYGNIGDIDLNISGSLNIRDDVLKHMYTDQYGVSINAGYAVSDVIKVSLYMIPSYSKTLYSDTDTDVKSTILDYGAGILAEPSDSFQFQMTGGRVDTWTNSSEGANPVWKLNTNVYYTPYEYLNIKGGYGVNKIVRGNLQQKLDMSVGYTGEEGRLIQNVGTGVNIDYIVDNGGSKVSSNIGWNGNLDLLPMDRLYVNTCYTGGYNEKYDLAQQKFLDTWTHNINLKMEHQITDIFMYSAGSKLSWYLPETLSNQFKQEYNGLIGYTPSLGWRVLSLSLSETFNITTTGSTDDYSSMLSFSSSIEALKRFNTHYIFGWSWINLHSSSPVNNFSHTIGFSLVGSEKASNFTTDYTFKHGSNDISHAVQSNFYYPFSDSFGVKAWINYNHYKEDGSYRDPFIVGISSLYLF